MNYLIGYNKKFGRELGESPGRFVSGWMTLVLFLWSLNNGEEIAIKGATDHRWRYPISAETTPHWAECSSPSKCRAALIYIKVISVLSSGLVQIT